MSTLALPSEDIYINGFHSAPELEAECRWLERGILYVLETQMSATLGGTESLADALQALVEMLCPKSAASNKTFAFARQLHSPALHNPPLDTGVEKHA